MNWRSKVSNTTSFTTLMLAIVLFLYIVGMLYNVTNKLDTFTASSIKANMGTTEEISMEKNEKTIVVFSTTYGDIELELFHDKAPKTVVNFIELAQDGFYTGTKFHRVIRGFMIQGGDPLSKDESRRAEWGTGGPGYQFEDEINDITITRGTLAMANSGPDTNGSQFFIVTADETPWLDGRHTVFGKVVKGMSVVERIENVVTNSTNDQPLTDVVIEKVEVK